MEKIYYRRGKKSSHFESSQRATQFGKTKSSPVHGEPERKQGRQHGGLGADCGLHPLIHTFAFEASAQDVDKKKAEPKLRSVFET